VVVVATGHYSVPRVLQVPGSTLPHVLTSKGLGRQDLHSRRVAKQVMVVGGGVSALEIANGMCEMGATVDLSYRGLHFTERWHHPSNKLLASLEKHVASKKLRLRMGTKVVWINQSHVGLRSAVGGGVNLDNRGPHIDPTTIFNNFTGDEIVLPAQSVIAAIGFDSDTSFFRDVARITLWSRSASGDGGTIQNGKPLLWQDGKLIKDKNNQWGESATKNLFVILTAGGVDGHVTKQHASNVNFEGCLGFFPAKQLSWKQVNVLPLSLTIARRVCKIETDLL
jgi:NADPH-dependent glutamate synthase beta subunit-like oxidoreductase